MLPQRSADPGHPPASESICESGRESRPLTGVRGHRQLQRGTELVLSGFHICSVLGFSFPPETGTQARVFRILGKLSIHR